MKTPTAIVNCDKHGTENATTKVKEVRVSMPDTKRQRLAGCPACRREAARAKTQ